MNVLLLGGTGAMGAHLTSILAGWVGVNLYVTSRRERLSSNNVHYVVGNALNPDFLKDLLSRRKWDVIVDFMAYYKTEEFQQRASLLLSSTDQYIFLSSARVYADSAEPIKEDSPRLLDVCEDKTYLATDEYALAKARQENILFNGSKKNWTIIRPYITFSEIRIQLAGAEKESWLYGALKGKPIFFSRDLADKFTTLTYGYDVAKGIAAIIGKKEAFGEAFHITSQDSYKWMDILENYLNTIEYITGNRPQVIWTERWSPVVGGGAMQIKWDRLYNRCFDNTKISKYIDLNTFKETIPTLSNCVSSFINKPEFGQIDWMTEARRDKVTGTWTNINEINGARWRIKYYLVRLGLHN